MALDGIFSADVPLRKCSLTHLKPQLHESSQLNDSDLDVAVNVNFR